VGPDVRRLDHVIVDRDDPGQFRHGSSCVSHLAKRYASQMAKEMSTATSTAALGRDEVIRRLVAAAVELFAKEGPDGVALRQVASAAGVNYGLIHQYIGTKDDLLRLVVRSVSEQAAERLSTASDLDGAIREM